MENIKVRIKKAPKMQNGGMPSITDGKWPAPNDPYWIQHPLYTEHTDGTFRHWGEDLQKDRINSMFHNPFQDIPMNTDSGKFPIMPSDKSRGLDNNYTPSRMQQKGPDVPTVHRGEGFAYGGQLGYGLDLGRNKYTLPTNNPNEDLNNTLKPVDRASANIEAEKGETIAADFNNDGSTEQLTVGGKRHSQGGTPLNVPGNAFVFSDTKKMKMGGTEVVPFGKPDTTPAKKYTPADLAKQYDINKYKALIDDPKSDPITKRTAELMVQNYEGKLGKLALVQEAKKGFPTGIPELSMDYLQQFLSPSTPQGGNIQQQTENTSPGSQMKYGGFVKYQYGGPNNQQDDPSLVDPYAGSVSKTPTGLSNKYNRSPEYLDKWESIIPGVSKMNNKAAQSAIYDYTLKNNPEAIRNMWSTYGLTHKGLSDPTTSSIGSNGKLSQSDLTSDNLSKLKSAYTDGYFGARQLDPLSLSTPPSLTSRNDEYIDPGKTPETGLQYRPGTPGVTNTPYTNVPGNANFNNGSNIPFDYLTPDKDTMDQAIINRAGLHKYMPWEAPINAYTPSPTFYDPSRELAANEESQNAQMQYNSEFSGPQFLGARNSQVSGQAAGQAANTISKYDQENVGVANQFANVDTDIMNKLSQERSASAQNLYTGNVIANQEFDNARMKLDNELLGARTNAWNNRATTGAINATNPYYYEDPRTGQITFTGQGNSLMANIRSGNSGGQDPVLQIKALTERLVRENGWSMEKAQEQAAKMIDAERTRTTFKGLNQIPSQTVRSGPNALEGIGAQLMMPGQY